MHISSSIQVVYQFFIFILLILANFKTQAAGFALLEQNVTNLGTAYAGTGALAIDASTNFYNPAGLTRLSREQIVGGGTFILPHTKLRVTNALDTTGTPLSPNTGIAKPSNYALVPLMHYAKPLNDNWVFGFSVVSTFGSKTNYKSNSIVRYTATQSEMFTVDLGPSVGYQFNNGFSLGIGVDAVFAAVKLDAQVGTGNLLADGFTKNRADNWGYGYHIGGLYEISDCTRFGLHYRSKVGVDLKGDSALQTSAFAPINNQDVRAKIDFPESVVLSGFHQFDENWAMMADLQWTRWERFKQIVLRFNNGSQLIANQDYKNAYRVSLGGSYQYDNCWQFKFGIMMDKTPTQNTFRNVFILDEDQVWLGLGVKYWFSDCLSLDIAGIYDIYKNARIYQPAPTAIGLPQTFQLIQGTSKNRIPVLGAQITWDFG